MWAISSPANPIKYAVGHSDGRTGMGWDPLLLWRRLSAMDAVNVAITLSSTTWGLVVLVVSARERERKGNKTVYIL